MRAALTMYDLPELAPHTDRLWTAIAQALASRGMSGVPEVLERGADTYALWTAPDLLLAQTCGYPLTHQLAGNVRVVATPRYAAAGCNGADYCSLIVVRDGFARSRDDLRGTRAAFNNTDSQSGYAALRAWVAPAAEDGRFFDSVMEAGSHSASLAAVREGLADVCAIDAVTLALMKQCRAHEVEGLTVIGHSPSTPGLPLITSLATHETTTGLLREALRQVATNRDLAETRRALLIDGFDVLPETAYDRVLDMERTCFELGYPVLA